VSRPIKTVVSRPLKTVVSRPLKTVVSRPLKTVVSRPLKTVVFRPLKTVVSRPINVVLFHPLKTKVVLATVSTAANQATFLVTASTKVTIKTANKPGACVVLLLTTTRLTVNPTCKTRERKHA
jgi:hypothetical protein